MSLTRLRISDFRCVESADIQFEQRSSIIVGDNGAGKTSILEAIYYLGRGRSFRQPRADRLVRHGCSSFTLVGDMRHKGAEHRFGVEAGRGESRLRLDGEEVRGFSDIAGYLAIQVIEPEIHMLVAEGPDRRRRYLDFGVFHVEPQYLDAWRRYTKVLKQRNAALRAQQAPKMLATWNVALVEAGAVVDSFRSGFVKMLQPHVSEVSKRLGLADIEVEYRPGWNDALTMEQALEQSIQSDRQAFFTHVGPHRADLRISWKGRSAKQQVSRGQQKLLASSLILAQSRLLASVDTSSSVLLVDDPAAELDKHSLAKLMEQIHEIPGQIILTAIDPGVPGLLTDIETFHVEQGVLERC